MMAERVIYCLAQCVALLTGVPHEELNQLNEGKVISIPEETIIILLEREPSVPVLYFSKSSYEHAIRGLSREQIEEVLYKRLKGWAPVAVDEAMNWVYRGQRRSLNLVAIVELQGNKQISGYFEENINLLARIVGDGRYTDLSTVDLIELALEGEARLMEEYADANLVASRNNSSDQAQRFIELGRMHKKFAIGLQRLLSKISTSEYARALPYFEPKRIWWISPLDSELTAGLRALRRPYVPWKKGFMIMLYPRQIQELVKQHREYSLIYLNSGKFLEDLQWLTSAQQEVEFRERLHRYTEAPLSEHWFYLMSLHLEQIIYKLNVLMIIDEGAVVPELQNQVREDIAAIKRILVNHPAWVDMNSSPMAVVELINQEEVILQEIKLFQLWVGKSGRGDLESRFASIAEQKKSLLEKLSKLNSK